MQTPGVEAGVCGSFYDLVNLQRNPRNQYVQATEAKKTILTLHRSEQPLSVSFTWPGVPQESQFRA